MATEHQIKYPKKVKASSLEQRSEEVSDIVERMPTGWTKLVVGILMLVVLTMLALGIIIKYPDTVKGQIIVTGEQSPIRLVSNSSGRLQLLVANNSEVDKGTCIGYIETGTNYKDVLKLDSLCHLIKKHDTTIKFLEDLELGPLSVYYNDFVLAYNRYEKLLTTKVYDNMRKTLRNQQSSDKKVAENLQKEIKLNAEVLINKYEQYLADSLLYSVGALSHEYLEQQYNNVLSCRQSNIELKSAELTKLSSVHSIDIQLAKIDMDVNEELSSALDEMMTKYNILINQILLWKELYLFVAPIDGTLQYLGFWRNNVHINASTEIFSISPIKNQMIGELLIPSQGAGKVKVGQDVNVKLFDYPYNEYGYIRGKVNTISQLTCNVESSDGPIRVYLVTVTFPAGLKTNFANQLQLNFESAGTGEVITERRRLIQRLFDNLKAKETK